MALEGAEMWICLAPEQKDAEEIPEDMGAVEIGEKTASERLRSVLFVWFKQEVEAKRYIGLFENFKREKMEKIIETIKGKLV